MQSELSRLVGFSYLPCEFQARRLAPGIAGLRFADGSAILYIDRKHYKMETGDPELDLCVLADSHMCNCHVLKKDWAGLQDFARQSVKKIDKSKVAWCAVPERIA